MTKDDAYRWTVAFWLLVALTLTAMLNLKCNEPDPQIQTQIDGLKQDMVSLAGWVDTLAVRQESNFERIEQNEQTTRAIIRRLNENDAVLLAFKQEVIQLRAELDSIKTWPAHVEGIQIEQIYTAQDSARIIEVDSVAIRWTHDWKDISGQPENVAYFEVSYLIDGVYAPLGRTLADGVNYRPPCKFIYHGLPIGKKVVPVVRAVDIQGNRSVWHSSLNEGWWIERVK